MANKNKRIKRLVNSRNSQEVADLALIPTLTQPVYYKARETSEETVDVRRVIGVDQSHENVARQIDPQLVPDLINELEFELEQSRIRQRGLERELDVREEITSSVNHEIREARQQIVSAAAELESLNNDYQAMRSAYEKAEQDTAWLRSLAGESGQLAAQQRARIDELETELQKSRMELADLRTYIDGRNKDWRHHEDEVKRQRGEIGRLADENHELRKAPLADHEREIRLCRDQIAEQAGELAARRQELDVLHKGRERLEQYANELRQRLQDQAATLRESADTKKKLEEGLEVAGSTIHELTLRIEEERAANRSLLDEQEIRKQEFEREVRQVRFELTSALDTIAEQHNRNEKLSSDLINNQEFRRALESHVGETENRYQLSIERLKKEIGKAREQISTYERKLRSKDGAIADLMQKIAAQDKGQAITSELETALQKIDGCRRKTTAGEPGRERARGRMTRQLIGTADGKELRFPLFRNRLSIGRTAHNDIQLNMRFVSRRHAVIATDNERTRIIDWGSRNGVYVNKKRVTECVLKSGDVIKIGLTTLRYEERTKN